MYVYNGCAYCMLVAGSRAAAFAGERGRVVVCPGGGWVCVLMSEGGWLCYEAAVRCVC